jgi:EmrB/QacA subfamily drug resistance transporter
LNVESKSSKRAAVWVASMAAFLTPFMGSSINVALPMISEEFGMDAVLLSWVATGYLLAAAVFLLPLGKLADIHGRKRVFMIGIAIYTVTSFLIALSQGPFILIGFRVLQGLGAAMIFGTSVAILTSIFAPGERGRVLGINVAAVYLGLSLGPVIGGYMTELWGWRRLVHVNAALGLIALAMTRWKLKGEWAESRGERFDLGGSILYGVALVALMYGFSLLPSNEGGGLVLLGLLGGVAFVLREGKQPHPVMNIALFRKNRVFLLSNLAALVNYSATFSVAFLLSLYLQYIQGLSPDRAGLVLLVQPIMMTVGSPFAGKLSDRIESRIIASLGMGLTCIGMGLLAFLHWDTSIGYILFGLAVLGAGLALFSSPNTNAVMSSVDRKVYGVASAILGTMRLVGQVFSMGLAMSIFALYIGKNPIVPEFYGAFLAGIKVAFAISAVLCFLGIFASLARGNVR